MEKVKFNWRFPVKCENRICAWNLNGECDDPCEEIISPNQSLTTEEFEEDEIPECLDDAEYSDDMGG